MMQMHIVHSREIPAPAEALGGLLDGLSGDDDRLWPADTWPTMPLILDRPLEVGAQGGHGLIRYAVEEYVPGLRVVFSFAPGRGLVGGHRFDVEPIDDGRSRLTHTFDARMTTRLIPLAGVVRRYHDAMIEDLLDRAEVAATGRHAQPARRPLWLRAANAVDIAVARRNGKLFPLPAPRPVASRGLSSLASPAVGSPGAARLARRVAAVASVALVAVGGLHAAWALGWRWPGGNDRALAERVVGGTELPPEPVVWAMAGALVAAGGVLLAATHGRQRRTARVGGWCVAAGLLIRGVVFLPTDILAGHDTPFDRLDLALYSPLCLVLGACAAGALWNTPRTRTTDGAPWRKDGHGPPEQSTERCSDDRGLARSR